MMSLISSLLTSSLVRIWKIPHWSPRCSFVWTLRVVFFPLKHSCLNNKINYFENRPFLSCLVPLFWTKAKFTTFQLKIRVLLLVNENLFSCERLCTRTHFETYVQDNLEMVYWFLFKYNLYMYGVKYNKLWYITTLSLEVKFNGFTLGYI